MIENTKPGSGAAFPREKAREGSPDYTGKLLDLDGKPLAIAVWEKTTQDGRRYLSFGIRPWVDRRPPGPVRFGQ